MKFSGIFTNNIGLKLLALFLAFVTLIYIGETTEKDSDDRTVLQKLFSRSDYITKKLLVRPIFVGRTPNGYLFQEETVSISPESVLVIGPSRVLGDKEYICTKPIDLGEHTKTKSITVELESIARSIKSQDLQVVVYLPISRNKDKPQE